MTHRFSPGSGVNRRTLLKAALLSGAVVGCSPAVTAGSSPPVSSASLTQPPAALTLDIRFKVLNDSINYMPHPRGCDQTTIRGSVQAADGAPQAGLMVRIWESEPAAAISLITDDGGNYAVDVAQGLSGALYHVQLMSSAGDTILSDVIVAQAIPDCAHNFMAINFVAIR